MQSESVDNLTAGSKNRYVPRRIFEGRPIDRQQPTPVPTDMRWYAMVIAINSLIAIVYFVLPLHGNPGSVLLGSAVYNHDAVLNAGILEWGYRSLWTPGLHFFDWPAGFPLSNTLPGTENLLGWQLFYSPLRALGASVAGSYDVALLSSLVISGVGTTALGAQLGSSRAGALFSGVAFAFNPFHVDHMVHLQTMAICWSPLALLGLEIAVTTGKRKGLLILGAAFVMTFLSGIYFGVFLTIVLIMYYLASLWLGRCSLSWANPAGLMVVACGSLILISPVLVHYLQFAYSFGLYPHPSEELALSSLYVGSLIRVPTWLIVWASAPLASPYPGKFAAAFPGLLVLTLCAIALRKSHRPRTEVFLLVFIAGTCLLLALGPTVELGPNEPSHFLSAILFPGKLWLLLSAIRWPVRIFMYSALGLALIAGFGVRNLERALPVRMALPMSVALLVALAIELAPAPWLSRDSLRIVDPIALSDAYSFLERERSKGGIVELPSATDSGRMTPYATRYAYASAGHLRGVVAFHGSLFPPLLEKLRDATYTLPKPEAIRLMKGNGVTRVVIHKDLMSADSAAMLISAFLADGDSIVYTSPSSTVLWLKNR